MTASPHHSCLLNQFLGVLKKVLWPVLVKIPSGFSITARFWSWPNSPNPNVPFQWLNCQILAFPIVPELPLLRTCCTNVIQVISTPFLIILVCYWQQILDSLPLPLTCPAAPQFESKAAHLKNNVRSSFGKGKKKFWVKKEDYIFIYSCIRMWPLIYRLKIKTMKLRSCTDSVKSSSRMYFLSFTFVLIYTM